MAPSRMASNSRSRSKTALRQRIAASEILPRPDRKLLEGERDALEAALHRPQHADRFPHHLRPDAVARKQRDPISPPHAPVTSFTLLKNCFLRSVLIPQFTGGHW